MDQLLDPKQDKKSVNKTGASVSNFLKQNDLAESLNFNSELLKKYLSLDKQLLVVSTKCNKAVRSNSRNNQQIIVTPPVDSIRYINKYFEEINSMLLSGGVFLGCTETAELRKKRILKKFPFFLNHFIYFFDFIFHRVLPKLSGFTRHVYFAITKGKIRVLPKAEMLGRLCSCGFKIMEYKEEKGNLTFVAQKIKLPDYNLTPSYGPFFKMKRIGKKGTMISVHKLRTMHAYSEYLQAYINEVHGIDEGGKFKDDFRVSSYGKFFRKFWIDEFPMIINFLHGDIKLVGVRPISTQYFELFSDELKQLRLKHTPGLIPPFYADLPKTLNEIIESEKKYLIAYEKNPFKTDLRYFKQSFVNIFFKRIRSK